MAKTKVAELVDEYDTELAAVKSMVLVFSCAVTSDLWDENPPDDDDVHFYTKALLNHLDRAEELFGRCFQAAQSSPGGAVAAGKTVTAEVTRD